MAKNALSEFIKNRKISVADLQKKKILYTRNGKPMELNYLWVLILKEHAGLSEENIAKLDKEFNLTDEEKESFEGMIKRKGKKSGTIPMGDIEIRENRAVERQRVSEMHGCNRMLSYCKEAREHIAFLREKAEQLHILHSVDWVKHKDITKTTLAETVKAMAKAIGENRVKAAEVQSKLLVILERFEDLVSQNLKHVGEDEGLGLLGEIPSVFGSFCAKDLLDETRTVERYGMDQMISRIAQNLNGINDHFIGWLNNEAKKAGGLVDITDYKPEENSIKFESWFEPLSFPDVTIQKMSMFSMEGKPLVDFYEIPKVITIIEKYVNQKIGGFKASPKALLR